MTTETAAPASTLTLVSPIPPVRRQREAHELHERGGLTILGFLSNRKPNTDLLQAALAERVREAHPRLEIRMYEKSNPSHGADDGLLKRIAQDCHAVINGTGD